MPNTNQCDIAPAPQHPSTAEATSGAGSVITHDAPAGELTVARAKSRSIPGWKRPRKG